MFEKIAALCGDYFILGVSPILGWILGSEHCAGIQANIRAILEYFNENAESLIWEALRDLFDPSGFKRDLEDICASLKELCQLLLDGKFAEAKHTLIDVTRAIQSFVDRFITWVGIVLLIVSSIVPASWVVEVPALETIGMDLLLLAITLGLISISLRFADLKITDLTRIIH